MIFSLGLTSKPSNDARGQKAGQKPDTKARTEAESIICATICRSDHNNFVNHRFLLYSARHRLELAIAAVAALAVLLLVMGGAFHQHSRSWNLLCN